MRKLNTLKAVYALLLACSVIPATASTTYSYVGKPFDTFSGPPPPNSVDAFTGFISVSTINVDTDTALVDIEAFVIDFSFTDGFLTLSLDNGSFLDDAFIKTDSLGNIEEWRFDFGSDARHQMTTRYDPSDTTSRDTSHRGLLTDPWDDYYVSVKNTPTSRGQWGIVPLPGSALLFGTSLLGLMGWKYKFVKK